MSVAVLLPVYRGDRAEHFHAALTSIEEQVDCEEPIHIYLGVDGPVGDAIDAVIERHSDYLHTIVRHPDNIGPTRNLNSLLEVLGDERLIFRMDADDISARHRLSRQIEFMDGNPDISILGTAIEEFDDQTGNINLRTFPTAPDDIPLSICVACPIAHPSVCIRPEIFEVTGGYPDMRGQDIALWFEALRRGYRISNLPEPLLHLRVSHGFLERRSWAGRAWPEFKIYMSGIWRLHGVTWRYIFPLARLGLRLAGPGISRRLYRSDLRNRLAGAESNRSGSIMDSMLRRTDGSRISVPGLSRVRRPARSRSRNT
mgnify:CR=1 FL=1